MLTKLEIYAIAFLVVVAACIGTYFYGRHDGTTIERAVWEKKAADAREQDYQNLLGAINTSNQIGRDNLAAIKGIRVTNTTINREVQREIATNTVYANDCLPASGILLWNAANRSQLPASATASSNDGRVPGAPGSGSQGRQGGNASIEPHRSDAGVPPVRAQSKGPSALGR